MRNTASSSILVSHITKNLCSSSHLIPIQHFHSQNTGNSQPSNGQFNHDRLTQLLEQCFKTPSLDTIKSLHSLAITMGPSFPQPIFLHNNIISGYCRLGDLLLARKLFDKMHERNVVSYNTMIGAYGRNGNAEEAWELFSEMRVCGFEPTQFTYGGLLSCLSLGLGRGSYLQALIIKSGLLCSDAFSGTALLSIYGRNGSLEEAIRAFEDIPKKNLVTWNTMISLLGSHSFTQESMIMFRELRRLSRGLSEYSYVGLLSGFVLEQDVELGEQAHGLLIKNGLLYKVVVANALMNMYMKCSGPQTAEKLFEDVLLPNIVSWNTIIGAFSKSYWPDKAFKYFLKMYGDGVLPDERTFVSVINSCTCSQILIHGRFVHAKIIKFLFDSKVFVGSALVDFYAKLYELEDARCCFDDIAEKNVVCWNALISGYSKKCCLSAVSLLREMTELGYQPNEFSLSAVLQSSFTLELQQVHSSIIKMGYEQNEYVLCSLITSYAKNDLISDALILVPAISSPLPVVPSNVVAGIYNRMGQYHEAQEIYSALEEPDIVSWNILIAACAHNGDYEEVFELFKHMQLTYIYPDKYTYVSLVSVCTKICNLGLGSSLHGNIIKNDPNSCDTFVYNVLIDMYGKCGSLANSVKFFNEITQKNLISWTALISVFGLHGYVEEALRKFREMETLGHKPDGVAFGAVLSACKHGGLVKEGKELFGKMKLNYGIEPDMGHYHLMVDLLTGCGHLKEAEQLIVSMPYYPNAPIWRCFLEGCKKLHSLEVLPVEHRKLESSG